MGVSEWTHCARGWRWFFCPLPRGLKSSVVRSMTVLWRRETYVYGNNVTWLSVARRRIPPGGLALRWGPSGPLWCPWSLGSGTRHTPVLTCSTKCGPITVEFPWYFSFNLFYIYTHTLHIAKGATSHRICRCSHARNTTPTTTFLPATPTPYH